MDPYVTFRIGHVSYETPTATSGGKNPQWKVSYRINLFKGMDRIHLEVYDPRNFTENRLIGECDVPIPREVMEGEAFHHWYPLMGREANANECQGDILIVMSFVAMSTTNKPQLASSTDAPVTNPDGNSHIVASTAASLLSSQSNNITKQHLSSAIPKSPRSLPYSIQDTRTIEEMFPTTDRRIITDLLDKHGGNKDLVVNHLLQNIV